MGKIKNKETVTELRKKVAKAKSIIVADYTGLKANDINNLRESMRQNNAELNVSKNTLLKIALKEENKYDEAIDKDLEGTNAVVFAYQDPVSPIKALFDFIKKLELPKVKAGIFEGAYVDGAKVEKISTLPSKEVLLGQMVGMLKSPLNGFVRVLNGSKQKLVYALAAIAEKKGK